jgi:hypothetical protein
MDTNAPFEASTPLKIRPRRALGLAAVLLVALLLYAVGSGRAELAPVEALALGAGSAQADSLAGGGAPAAGDRPIPGPNVEAAPLARLVLGLALLTNPTESDADWARALACALLALSWWGLCGWLQGGHPALRSPAPWLLLGLLLATGAFREAAAGAGAAALMIAVSTLMARTAQSLSRAPESLWSLGLVWGLAILLHPALIALGVPIFALGARAYARDKPAAPGRAGDEALPSVPLSLLASPVVALATVLALWTGLGPGAGGALGHLASSVDALWRSIQSPTEAAGHLFDQSLALAPSPGPAIWEVLGSLPILVVALALVGLLVRGPDGGRRVGGGLLLTVMLAGALDGDLTILAAYLVPLVAALALRGLVGAVARFRGGAGPLIPIKGGPFQFEYASTVRSSDSRESQAPTRPRTPLHTARSFARRLPSILSLSRPSRTTLTLALVLGLGACGSPPPPTVAPGGPPIEDITAQDVAQVDTPLVEDTVGLTCTSDLDCELVLGDVALCHRARCDLIKETCVTAIQPDGLGCDDGNVCTTNDTCGSGVCSGGVDVNCDDDNVCTEDSCAPEVGCFSVPTEGACDDGNPCTSGDSCSGGECHPTGQTSCEDQNPCTDDSCTKEQGCFHTIRTGEACDDGNACSLASSCTGGGVCTGVEDLDCDDGDVCTSDSCDSGFGCVNNPSDAPCNDGDPCTGPDACVAGTCHGEVLDCEDSDPCTIDACVGAAECTHEPLEGPCDDENPCTVDEACGADGLCVGVAEDCEDGNPCTLTFCDPGDGCTALILDGSLCEDGDLCSVFDECDSEGACVPGPAPSCTDENPCTNDFCDPATGCVNENFLGPCDDVNPCTSGETCQQGFCAGELTDCDDNNVCTDDACSIVTGCAHTPVAGPCDDGSVCTLSDTCVESVCTGDALDCGDDNPCSEDLCHKVEGCSNPLLADDSPCEDGDLCTLNGFCDLGLCTITGELVACFDDDPCTADVCDPALGCAFITEPACLPPTAWPVINEIDYAQAGVDTADFVELVMVGDQTVSIELYTLELIDGDTQELYDLIYLGQVGEQMHPGERIIIGPPSVANPADENTLAIVVLGDFLQNGGTNGDALRVVRNGIEIMDSVSYEAPVLGASEGEGHVGFDSDLLTEGLSFGRCPDGLDNDDNASDFVAGSPTPGTANDCPDESVPTFWEDVQPIFMTWCSACHFGDSLQECAGQACFVSHYPATQMESAVCLGAGETVGACTVARILDMSMPKDNPGIVPSEDIEVLENWVATGMQEGTEPPVE